MEQPRTTLVEVNDPVETARSLAVFEQGKRNSDWLQAHWGDLLPQARGHYVAVAGQEAFIADTPEQAWAWAETTHPEDKGAIVQYVMREGGPRFYGNRVERSALAGR